MSVRMKGVQWAAADAEAAQKEGALVVAKVVARATDAGNAIIEIFRCSDSDFLSLGYTDVWADDITREFEAGADSYYHAFKQACYRVARNNYKCVIPAERE